MPFLLQAFPPEILSMRQEQRGEFLGRAYFLMLRSGTRPALAEVVKFPVKDEIDRTPTRNSAL